MSLDNFDRDNPLKGKKRRRKKVKNTYFTQETQDAIIAYNNETDPKKKDKIFQDNIYYPFYKLAENIINRWQFYSYMEVDTVEDLKLDVVAMLVLNKMEGYNPEKGKAFSYFGTIVKRWLIEYNNKNYKNLQRVGNFGDYDDSFEPDYGLEDNYEYDLSSFLDMYVRSINERFDILFIKDDQRAIASAVLTVIESRRDLELLKKRAIYIYVREMTNLDTSHITKVLKIMKKEFYFLFDHYNDKGLIDLKN